MRYQSIVQEAGHIASWPEFIGDRIYMLPFFKADGLPASARPWQGVVDTMLEGIETDQPIYLMVDQAFVPAGGFHRRPGLHIDGYWGGKWQDVSAHGPSPSGGHGSRPTEPSNHHRPAPHHSNMPPERERHSPAPSRHSAGSTDWASAAFDAPEAIILASNVSASHAFYGDFEGPIGDMGDCAAIDVSGLVRRKMVADMVYAGNVTMLHETLPCEVDCYRSVVRLNVPGWTP